MRIGIDGKVLSPRAGGIGRSAINLTRNLLREAALQGHDVQFSIFSGPQTSREVLASFDGPFEEHYFPLKSSVLRSLTLLPAMLESRRIDLFHGLDHVGVPLLGWRGRCITTLHDVIPLLLPETFTLKHRLVVRATMSRVVRRADRVMVPTEAVKRDVIDQLGIPGERVRVIHWGCEERFSPDRSAAGAERVRAKYALPAAYVLALGTLEPRKNLTTLLAAFARLRQRPDVPSELRLVIAGPRGWRDAPIFEAVDALGLSDAVSLPGYIDDDDLPDLYRGAELLAFPSLYEGFGLPIVEAMRCGVPVITSDRSAMPEVAGGAALLVDPHDANALATALARVLVDDELRLSLRAKGLARAREFSWPAAARQTLELYRSLAG